MNEVETQPSETRADTERQDYFWLGSAGLITAIAAFLRFFWLDLKPLHHDEGVNGFFLTNLVRDGVYKYDPANYHGPTLYYIALPFVELFGLKTIPVRISVGIFGVLTVVLIFYLRRYIGRSAALFGALLVALSPGMVFISRYFIHEIFFVFLSLAFVVALLFFMEKRKAGPVASMSMVLILLVCLLPSALNLAKFLGGSSDAALWALRVGFFLVDAVLVYYLMRMLLAWNDGTPIYMLLAAACISLFFATKETAFITLGTMAIACFSIWIWQPIRQGGLIEKHGMKLLAAAHIILAAVLVYYRQTVMDGLNWMSTTFLSTPNRQPEYFVYYGILFLMAAAISAWILFLIDQRNPSDSEFEEPSTMTLASLRKSLGDNRNIIILIAAAAVMFAYLGVLFFSSFFTYAEGVGKAFEAYAIWTKTGNKDHTQNGIFGYLKWGMKLESSIIIVSLLGTLISLVKARHRFAMFAGLWAYGLFLAYTIIPYKTPWLALSFLLPMCISAGYGFGELFTSKNISLKAIAAVLAVASVAVLSYQTYQLNFVRYDDEEMSYVYAHTKRGFHDLMAQVEHYAQKSGKGHDATIEIVSPDYWPMTWYLLDYKHANFHGNLVDASTSEMVITKKNDQDAAAIQRYSTHYKYVGVYPLRPGVNLVLLVRKDLADPDAEELYKVLEYKTVPGYTQ